MQVEYKTEKGSIVFYLLPENTISYKLYSDFDDSLIDIRSEFVESNRMHQKWFNVRLKGEWQLIGLVNGVTEEQAKMIMSKSGGQWNSYKDYTTNNNWFSSALWSFKSLKDHLNIQEGNWIILFKPE